MFQSTRPRGARPNKTNAIYSPVQVSIHAPAWGATSAFEYCVVLSLCFNPRARVGRDKPGLTLYVDS